MNIRLDDAMELGQLLQFLDDWLSTDHGPVDESLTRFVGCEAYGVESLRDDLARFTFLLGESDGEGLFSPRTPTKRDAGELSVLVCGQAVRRDCGFG
jgi:hypothetical protein